MSYSCSQNFWSNYLLIIVCLKEGSSLSLGCLSSPMSWLFYNLHGCTVPPVELDNTIWFSTLSRMSGFLSHSSKWAHQFGCFLQYMSGLEVFACSLSTNLNYVITMLQLHLSLNPYVKLQEPLGRRCGCILGVFS